MTIEQLLAIVLASALGAFIQGVVGFGVGLVLLALLTPVLGVKEAAVVGVLPVAVLIAVLAWKYRRSVKWDETVVLGAMLIVGAPLGVKFLVKADVGLVRAIMGLVLLASAVQRLLPGAEERSWPRVLAVPLGLFAGALNGAFGTGGPPLIAYLSARRLDHLTYVATLQFLFVIGVIVRLEELIRQGLMTEKMVLGGSLGAVGALIGAFAGVAAMNRINEKAMAKLVTAALLALGLYYLLSGSVA